MRALDSKFAGLHADLTDLSQQLRMTTMRVDQRKIFATTGEDEPEGVVNSMMTNVYQAAGGGGDVLAGTPGGSVDDAQVPLVTCMMVVSASQIGESVAGTGYFVVGRHSVVRGHWCHRKQTAAA